MSFSSAIPSLLAGNTAGSTARNQTGINSLLVFDMPAEFGWTIGEIPLRIFGDFAVNFDGDDRAVAAGHPERETSVMPIRSVWASAKSRRSTTGSSRPGISTRNNSRSIRTWLIRTSSIAASTWKASSSRPGMRISDAVIFNLSYGYGEQADGDLGTGGRVTISLNPLKKYQIFQADLNVKF